jgi:hypothetical protein
MRRVALSIILCFFSAPVIPQSPGSDAALLAKTRALYDAPFTRNLVSFDCAVQFDWKKHLVDTLGAVPPTAEPTVDRLQGVKHRVFVDRSGATVSAIPKAPDLTGVEHATELEQAFSAMVSQGLDAWIPFSTNVILPVGSTKFGFKKLDPGYRLTMNGPGVAATLLLDADLRLTSGVTQLPQDLRFTTEFARGPDGYLLQSVRTGSTAGTDTAGEATFAYTYQTVQGFQLPSDVTITPPTNEVWRVTLTDCKAMSGVALQVAPPPSAR